MPQATPSAILVQYILKQIKIGAFVATQDWAIEPEIQIIREIMKDFDNFCLNCSATLSVFTVSKFCKKCILKNRTASNTRNYQKRTNKKILHKFYDFQKISLLSSPYFQGKWTAPNVKKQRWRMINIVSIVGFNFIVQYVYQLGMNVRILSFINFNYKGIICKRCNNAITVKPCCYCNES